MKSYPSIPPASSFREIPKAHIFDKLDGSSMRSEWTSKRGWYKHGRRHGLLDDSNPLLRPVPGMFERMFAEPLGKVARKNKWQHLIVFYEFWGDKSIAGRHLEGDDMRLTLFDAAADKKGIIGPKKFRRIFEGSVETAKFLGIHNFTRGFVKRVRSGDLDGITFEGVVAKAGIKHDIVRGKAKTQKWIDQVRALWAAEEAEKIINS